jgi:hypothetical protein
MLKYILDRDICIFTIKQMARTGTACVERPCLSGDYRQNFWWERRLKA